MKLSKIILLAGAVAFSLFAFSSCASVDPYSEEFQENASLADVSKTFQSQKSAETLYKDVLAWVSENNAGGVQSANLTTEKNARIGIDCKNVFVVDTSTALSTSDVTSELRFAIDIAFKDGEVVFTAKDVVITPKVSCVYVKTLFGTSEKRINLHWGDIKHTEGPKGGNVPDIRMEGSAKYLKIVDTFLKNIEAISTSS